jgi:hypothetical protein
MSRLTQRLSAALAWPAAFFAFTDPQDERRGFGLGHFVLLLSLLPFALDLSLFNLGGTAQGSWYFRPPVERFQDFPTVLEALRDPGSGDGLQRMARWCQAIDPRLVKALNLQNRAVDCRDPARRLREDPSPKRFGNLVHPAALLEQALCAQMRKDGRAADFGDRIACGEVQQQLAQWQRASAAYQDKLRRDKLASEMAQAQRVPTPALRVLRSGLAAGLSGGTLLATHTLSALLAVAAAAGLYAAMVRMCWRRRHLGLLFAGLAVPHAVLAITLLAFVGPGGGLGAASVDATLFVASHLAFLWFAWRGHIRSRSFGIFMLLLTLAALAAEAGRQDRLLAALGPVLAFLLMAALARGLVHGAVTNAAVLRELGAARSLRSLGHALLLWLPMALITVPFFVLTEKVIPDRAVEVLHRSGVLLHGPAHDFRDNALESVADHADQAAFGLYQETEKLGRRLSSEAASLRDQGLEGRVTAIFDQVMPAHLAFEPVRSGVALVGPAVDLGVELAQGGTDAAYGRLRAQMRIAVQKAARQQEQAFKTSLLDPAEGRALALLRQARRDGTQAILRASDDFQQALWWQIGYLRAAHRVMLLLFAFVCIKSFGYVFARIAFHRDQDTEVTLEPTGRPAPPPAPAAITRVGAQYVFACDAPCTFFVSRRFQCRGKAPRFWLPQPLHAPVARLLHRAMSMNRVDLRPGDSSVSCTTTRGAEFVEWRLVDGEQVVFDFAHFVAMSQDITISTLISTRLSTLLLGRFIFSVATGPGTLVLMTRGRAEVTGLEGAAESLPPERLVAMHAGTRLHVDRELGLVDVYLSAAHVRPAGGGQVIVDVDRQGGSGLGLARFLRHFLWPA